MERYESDWGGRDLMGFMFDLKTWFKITAHPFPHKHFFVRYRSDRTKGREYMVHIWFTQRHSVVEMNQIRQREENI